MRLLVFADCFYVDENVFFEIVTRDLLHVEQRVLFQLSLIFQKLKAFRKNSLNAFRFFELSLYFFQFPSFWWVGLLS